MIDLESDAFHVHLSVPGFVTPSSVCVCVCSKGVLRSRSEEVCRGSVNMGWDYLPHSGIRLTWEACHQKDRWIRTIDLLTGVRFSLTPPHLHANHYKCRLWLSLAFIVTHFLSFFTITHKYAIVLLPPHTHMHTHTSAHTHKYTQVCPSPKDILPCGVPSWWSVALLKA